MAFFLLFHVVGNYYIEVWHFIRSGTSSRVCYENSRFFRISKQPHPRILSIWQRLIFLKYQAEIWTRSKIQPLQTLSTKFIVFRTISTLRPAKWAARKTCVCALSCVHVQAVVKWMLVCLWITVHSVSIAVRYLCEATECTFFAFAIFRCYANEPNK